MKRYSLSHLDADVLVRDLARHLAHERSCTADVLAHIAEVDTRRLYVPLGYPSMYAYCTGKLHLSEDATWKRLQAASAARRCPGVFVALAEGRLHLSAVVLLAPHLCPENADELIAAATHKSKSEIGLLLAERFPKAAVEARLGPIPAAPQALALDGPAPGQAGGEPVASAPAPGQVTERPRVTPLAPEAFALQCTLDREGHDALRYVQRLLGHGAGSRDLGTIIGQALKLMAAQLEKRKFAATDRPRRGQKAATPGSRHIPAHVKRAVWARDGGQCTFVSESGHRCQARDEIQYDHKREFARGGEATVDGIQLRCRAHNQYTAEQTFGAAFMSQKRDEARRTRAETKAQQAASPAPPVADASQEDLDVIPWLRGLGYSAAEARRADTQCEYRPEASLEERLRVALRQLLPPHRKIAYGPVTAS